VLDEDPPLATAHELMQRFRQVVRDRDLLGLDRWLAHAASSELPPFVGFTRGIATDRAAVDAAFALPWSTGPVDGPRAQDPIVSARMISTDNERTYVL
jgi:transposase